MSAALRAGVAYFTIVFAAGFVLGTIRVLVVMPRLGEMNAVAIEIPIMLALSWAACAWLVRRFAVPRALVNRIAMGGLAFELLMLGEFGVSVPAFGRTSVDRANRVGDQRDGRVARGAVSISRAHLE